MNIRAATSDDAPFVFSSFLKSQRREGANGAMSNDIYFDIAHREAERIAQGSVVVAYVPEEPWLIAGWLAFERGPPIALAYAYVRHSFRRAGVFDALWRHVNPDMAPAVVRHVGRSFGALRARYRLTYDPRSSQ